MRSDKPDPVDALQRLVASLPPYGRDAGASLMRAIEDPALEPVIRYGLLLVCAHAARSRALVQAIAPVCAAHLTPQAGLAAQSIAAQMALTAVYHRAVHLLKQPDLDALPAGLKTNAALRPGVPTKTAALWSLAAAAVHGCEACLVKHHRAFRAAGGDVLDVRAALQIAASASAIASVLATQDPPD